MNRTIQATVLALGLLGVANASGPPSSVETETLRQAQAIELDGLIEPFKDLNIGAQVDGVLADLLVERGDMVLRGQVVATLESEIERAQMQIAKARAESTAQLDSAAAAVKLNRQRVERTRKLYEDKVISEGALDEAETELELSELQLIQAQENQAMAKLELGRAETLLEQRSVRSPISGVVVERYLGPGETVYRANSDQILRIAQIHPLHVEIIAPLSVYGRVKVGDIVEVFPDSPVGGRHEARVTVVDKVIDAASGTIGIRCGLENMDHAIPAGLRCRVRVPLREDG